MLRLYWLLLVVPLAHCGHIAGEPDLLGLFNGKNWYIDMQQMAHAPAHGSCQQRGTKLAEIQSLEEAEWVLSRTTAPLMWTAAVNNDARAGYYWGMNSATQLSSAVPFYGNEGVMDGVGLALSRQLRGLVSRPRTTGLPSLCTD